MFRNLKIRIKLSLIFILFNTASVLIISYIGFHIAEKSLRNARIEALKSIAHLKVEKIEKFLFERKGDIKTAQNYFNIKTNLPIVTQFANDRKNPAYLTAKKMLDEQLKSIQYVYGYSDVMLVSPEGKIVYVTNESCVETNLDQPLPGFDGKAFEEEKEEISFSDVFFRSRNKIEGNDFGMLVTAPVHDFKERFIGVIAFEIDMELIYKFIQDTTGLGETGETLIGLNKGDYALFLNNLRHDEDGALKRKAIFGEADAFPIQEAVQGRDGAGISIDYRGEKIIAAWRHIQSLNWGLVAKIDTIEAFAPIIYLKNITICMTVIVIAVTVIIVIFLTKGITRPIRKLVEGTKRIANGDLAFRIETKLKDEIGDLATSFNDMTFQLAESKKQLQDYALNLEENVEEKTDEIKRSKEFTENLIETAQDAIVCDENGIITIWNKYAEKLFGYSKSEIIGQPVTVIIPEKYKKKHEEGLKLFLKTGKAHIMGKTIEMTGRTKEGIEIQIEMSSTFQKIGMERYIFTAIIRDITERKQKEQIFLQSEKLKALGVISSGIAHEFNNILAIIKGYSQLLEWKSSDNREFADGLRSINMAADDGAQIVRRILEFTKVGSGDLWFENVDIKELIEQAIDFSRLRWKAVAQSKGITYRIDSKGLKKVTAVRVNPVELREVLLNIINNALDAMPGGGTISFRTRRKGDTVFVKISDTGTGMTKDVLERIFDPFFTTRMPEGSGLGMSVAFGIIKRHGGKIEVESELGKGSTITLSLPAAGETTHSVTLPKPTEQIKAKNLRILVVDDEQDICKVLNKYFSDEGHNVRCVDNGTEAIKLLKSESFDLVLCELVMPEVSGRDVIKELNTLDKRPKVGLITGWSEKMETSHNEDSQIDFIIKKPFDFSELSKQINNVFNKG